jgi:hypothetical protein
MTDNDKKIPDEPPPKPGRQYIEESSVFPVTSVAVPMPPVKEPKAPGPGGKKELPDE